MDWWLSLINLGLRLQQKIALFELFEDGTDIQMKMMFNFSVQIDCVVLILKI